MLDNRGDSVVLVSTIPSAFIVADDLVPQPQTLSAAARADVPRCSGLAPRAGGSTAIPNDDQSAASPDRRSSDDCSEITSTVADEPAAFAPFGSPSAASASPPPDYGKQSATAEVCEVVGSKLASTREQPATASGAVTSTAELITSAMTSTSVTATTTTTSQQIGRQKKSLEMVVNLLKRPSTSSTTSSSSSLTTTCSAAEPARASSLPVVTSSSIVPTSGHVMLNGGAGDDSVGLSLLQRLVAMPPSAYWQPPVPTSSHFRFRSASMLPAARSAETGPPIKQLKHMCKNVRSFVPSAARRASQWQHPALNMLFGTAPRVPVIRHRAAAPPPPRAAAAYRGACVRSQDFSRPRFHAPATRVATSGVSRERKQCSDGELSALMRVLLEASGNSCHTSASSSSPSPTFPSTADLWKAAIN